MPVASVTGHLTTLIGDHGVYAVFVLMAIDAVFPAFSELVMLYAGAVAAGALAGQHVVLFGGRISTPLWAYVTMVLAGTIGYTLGAIGGWAIGSFGGRPFLDRYGRWLHLGPERLARAEHWFDRYGRAAVFLGRITPVVRSFISVPAGLFRMALGGYAALTLAGSTLWCLAFAGAGWGLGSHWKRLHEDFRYVDYAVLVLVVAAVVYALIRRRSSRLGRRAADPAG